MGELINRQALLEVCDQDEDMAGILLEAFEEESASQLENITDAYENEDWNNYVVYVHGMKSSSRSIGALTTGDLAYELEMAGKENNIALIKEKHSAFINVFKETVEAARNFTV